MYHRTGYFFEPPALAADYPSHVQWTAENAILSPPDCAALIEIANRIGWSPAAVGSGDRMRIDPAYRCVSIASIPYTAEVAWLYERVTSRIHWANCAYWRFDLTGLLEPFQVLRYEAPKEPDAIPGHYDWHQDFGAGQMGRRKLTFLAQMSAPSDYDGCDLTLMSHQQEKMPYRNAGDAIAFPCWTPHQVSAISRGTRYALVNWIHGPPLR
jgi:PKHD-type hydroxylase